jgi:hypothetical protein
MIYRSFLAEITASDPRTENHFARIFLWGSSPIMVSELTKISVRPINTVRVLNLFADTSIFSYL